MIISAFEVRDLPEVKTHSEFSENEIQSKLNALELLIRSYTNNNFQKRGIRFAADSGISYKTHMLNGYHPFIERGDTVQISESGVNDGLYIVKNVFESEKRTELDKKLYPVRHNLITKIEYPDDIKAGVIKLLQWDLDSLSRIGVKSETISRHSVTYFEQDKNNEIMGYPAALMGFLTPYIKARFGQC
ncbi:MAG: hypothetical protein ACTTK5_01340 [Candidatus Fimenecus sp.]